MTALKQREEITPRQEALVMVGFRGLSVSDPRIATLDVIETILSGGAGRLFTQIREERGLAYTVGAFGVHGVDPGFFVLYAVTQPREMKAVTQSLLQEIRTLSSSPVSEQELRRAKQGLLGERRIARQTQAAEAAQMSLDELYGLGFDFPARYDEWVEKATPEDVQGLSRELLDPNRCVTLIGQPRRQKEEALPRS